MFSVAQRTANHLRVDVFKEKGEIRALGLAGENGPVCGLDCGPSGLRPTRRIRVRLGKSGERGKPEYLDH